MVRDQAHTLVEYKTLVQDALNSAFTMAENSAKALNAQPLDAKVAALADLLVKDTGHAKCKQQKF